MTKNPSPNHNRPTIQTAINVAKKGDTILVLPGTYAPIKTDNCILSNTGASQFKKNWKNTVRNCYKGTNPGFAGRGGRRLSLRVLVDSSP